MRIAFQGEIGAFSEEAARVMYPAGDRVPMPSMEAVFEAVEQGNTERGVIPIDNSLFGSVHINYDLLRSHQVSIVGELRLRIRHCLMAMPGATLEGITRVQSHPQALGQCREYLKFHLSHAETVPAYDTAGAAKLVAAKGDPHRAAIAPERAADEYGLEVLAANIESHSQNYTRFLALAQQESARQIVFEEGRPARTSIVFAPRANVPGALFKCLAVFFLRDLDLLKVESRPLVGQPGKYIFYLDVDGGVRDPVVQQALRHLSEISAELRVLGSYNQGSSSD
ncbi:MAG: prephenate dehydratase [Bacteroidota bacterium]|nr:prephenate dehydratase [Bacteroidota bacterium]MDE2834362.1 prephenate dehydratase [Bacteroidota bacterium]MDE2955461.1 prephenate dehydratase [Bacteroidota bacterium]